MWLVLLASRFLVAAGDPLQLPPVIAAPAHVTSAGAAQQQRGGQQLDRQRSQQVPLPGQPQQRGQQGQLHGLLRPLFVRLVALGQPPFLLRRQYRCHPDISAVPNQQFYGGRLLDGVGSEQRPSLLPGLPNLAFVDVRGQEQYGAGEPCCIAPFH
jgi:superfamily I DNA and/or RNA helicase